MRGAARTRPRRAALSARHRIGNKTLTGLPVSCSRPWTRAPARNTLRGLSTALHPRSPARPRGARATYRSARLLGAAARPGWVRRALSLGRKRNRVDGRRALTRRLLCGEPRAARPGRGGRRAEGGPGEVGAESAQLPSPAPRGTRKAGWRAAGGGRAPGVGGEGAPVPEHQLLSGRPGPRSRRLRGSAPPIPPACPQEKKLGGR